MGIGILLKGGINFNTVVSDKIRNKMENPTYALWIRILLRFFQISMTLSKAKMILPSKDSKTIKIGSLKKNIV